MVYYRTSRVVEELTMHLGNHRIHTSPEETSVSTYRHKPSWPDRYWNFRDWIEGPFWRVVSVLGLSAIGIGMLVAPSKLDLSPLYEVAACIPFAWAIGRALWFESEGIWNVQVQGPDNEGKIGCSIFVVGLIAGLVAYPLDSHIAGIIAGICLSPLLGMFCAAFITDAP